MNIGLLGGTFDPIHLGHLALARAASEKFKLQRVLFVPANIPPHKQKQPVSEYFHRYAMVALATVEDKTFFPSLLEAPSSVGEGGGSGKSKGKSAEAERPSYTIDTVRSLKQTLRKSDHLFFLIGIDAFVDIAKWFEACALLKECEFIVASRPGYSLADVANALPENIRPSEAATRPFHKLAATGGLVLPGATIRLLDGVHQKISSSAIREAAGAGKTLGKGVSPLVAEYVRKMGLYGKKR
jgi:nicotinate-nucleotide adenylyltransferase